MSSELDLRDEISRLHAQIQSLQQRLAAYDDLDAIIEPNSFAVTLNNAPFWWDTARGQLTFFGLPAVLFWIEPSVRRMLEPLVAEMGAPLFRLLVAHEGSKGADESYHAIVTTLADNFADGFLAWGRTVGVAGWGEFLLPVYDPRNQCAEVLVKNPWELRMQQYCNDTWGCPFLQGRIIGLFTHAFKTQCWADEQIIWGEGAETAVHFRVYASQRTISDELNQIRQARLREIEAQRTREALLAELSSPLIPIADQVLVMPLIGAIDSRRAQQIMESLLAGVARHRASTVLLDITGVRVVDTQVANAFLQAAQAVRLLGARVILTGIQPQIAQTLVHLGVDLSAIETRSTLQDGVASVLINRR